jgi:hypothetical protein
MVAQILNGLSFDYSVAPTALIVGVIAVFALAAATLGRTTQSGLDPRDLLPRTQPHVTFSHAAARSPESDTPRFLPKEPGQRRSSLRRGGNATDVEVCTQGEVNPFAATVIDRSCGGLRLCVPRQLALHSTIRVRAAQAPEDSPWLVVDVRHCESRGDHWEVGCRFLESPPWSILLLFG